MKTDYKLLVSQAAALIEDVPHKIANLANISALLFDTLSDINWAGFYLLEGETLILGPFQGKVACTQIGYGKGVCGTAVKENRTVLVKDVHQFEGHIACDCASQSEIVVPVRRQGEIIGVLDIDSPIKERFDKEDQEGLEKLVAVLEEQLLQWK
jgi:GAF domain-containing protein